MSSAASITLGHVLHWKNFQFSDGDEKHKYFVVIGARANCDYLFVIATSKRHRMDFTPGCNSEWSYFHIPGGGRDFFPRDTWLLLMRCVQQRQSETLKLMGDGAITVEGALRQAVVEAIQECLRRCDDVSAAQLALL
jgi:hypothetical protein